jgi:hypothetical protein
MNAERGYDRFLRGYLRWFLHIVKWWSVGAIFVATVILACILIDWIGRLGWGYPWYSLPIPIVVIAFAIVARRMATNGLAHLDACYNSN